MKKSTVKLIGFIVTMLASVIIIFGAFKTGITEWKDKQATTTETAQVQVLEQA